MIKPIDEIPQTLQEKRESYRQIVEDEYKSDLERQIQRDKEKAERTQNEH